MYHINRGKGKKDIHTKRHKGGVRSLLGLGHKYMLRTIQFAEASMSLIRCTFHQLKGQLWGQMTMTIPLPFHGSFGPTVDTFFPYPCAKHV